MIYAKKIAMGIFFLFAILFSLSFFDAQFSISNPQLTSPGSSFSYLARQGAAFPAFSEDQCKAGQDFIVQVAPFGCTPAVVRSDLLEEPK